MATGTLSAFELATNKLKHQTQILTDLRKNSDGIKAILLQLNFRADVKTTTLARQKHVCAFCGKIFIEGILFDLDDAADKDLDAYFDYNEMVKNGRAQYHHVLPRRFGITTQGKTHHSDFMKETVNCVALHTGCHAIAHNYNYAGVEFLDATAFGYSHGEHNDQKQLHLEWVVKHKREVEQHAPYLSEELGL
jgi:hypothetical protein